MKTTLTVLATVGSSLLAASALAQTNVQIYGFFNVDFENVEADGGSGNDLPSRNRVSNNLSHIGFRGTEELGNGLKAIFQLESGVWLDGSPPTPAAASLGSRNSNLGLQHNKFGILFYGIWETPYKLATSIPLDPFFTNTIAGANAILGNGFASGGNGAVPASFDRRINNTVNYWTPKWAGFFGRLAYAANEEKNNVIDPSLWSLSAAYENGPLYVVYAYERHEDFFASGTDDTGHKIGIGYTFGNTRVRAVFERLRYEPTTNTDLRRDAWQIAATHTIGQHTFRVSYVRAEESEGDATVTIGGVGPADTDSGARQISLGYGYALSKRTEVYAIYVNLKNDRTALYNLSTNPLGGLQAGQDPEGFGLGIRHTF